MERRLLSGMRCPYCLGRFELARVSELDGDRIVMGLVRCRCFEFPVVEGVLLLSLAKGYGGAEERLQPYVAIQAAAIHFLARGRVQDLRRWVRRHAPLVARLGEGRDEFYLDFMRVLTARLQAHIEREMYEVGRFQVLGKRGHLDRSLPGSLPVRLARKAWATRVGTELNALRKRVRPHPAWSFYVNRFASRDTVPTRATLRALPHPGPMLSLCCGHGIFEFIYRSLHPDATIVSIDGQLLNLLVTKRFVHPGGAYVCHDLQFPLPFEDGAFGGVFSSTCLAEIPTQASFVREATRVTAAGGWTLFDTVWVEEAARRVDPLRFYRFCQNFFGALSDYHELFQTLCGKDRRVFAIPPELPLRFLEDAGAWSGDRLSVLVAEAAPGGAGPGAFDLTEQERRTLSLAPGAGDTGAAAVAGEAEVADGLARGRLCFLPERFSRDVVRVGPGRT